MSRSKWRGHYIECVNDIWIYSDNKQPVSEDKNRSCGNFGKPQTKEGHDGCIGTLENVKNACCGHGPTDEAYIQYKNGEELRGKEALSEIRRERNQESINNTIDKLMNGDKDAFIDKTDYDSIANKPECKNPECIDGRLYIPLKDGSIIAGHHKQCPDCTTKGEEIEIAKSHIESGGSNSISGINCLDCVLFDKCSRYFQFNERTEDPQNDCVEFSKSYIENLSLESAYTAKCAEVERLKNDFEVFEETSGLAIMALKEQITMLKQILEESNKYLMSYPETYIGQGSILHIKMVGALEEIKGVSDECRKNNR